MIGKIANPGLALDHTANVNLNAPQMVEVAEKILEVTAPEMTVVEVNDETIALVETPHLVTTEAANLEGSTTDAMTEMIAAMTVEVGATTVGAGEVMNGAMSPRTGTTGSNIALIAHLAQKWTRTLRHAI